MAVTSLMLLMLVINSCRSNKVNAETKVVYVLPELHKPKYPDPKNKVVPYDKDFQKVTDVDTDIEYVVMPFWYYKLIVNYKVFVDEEFTKYEAFRAQYKPP